MRTCGGSIRDAREIIGPAARAAATGGHLMSSISDTVAEKPDVRSELMKAESCLEDLVIHDKASPTQ